MRLATVDAADVQQGNVVQHEMRAPSLGLDDRVLAEVDAASVQDIGLEKEGRHDRIRSH